MIALLYNESRFHPKVVSPAGAAGIAQFMPDTAREYGLVPTARSELWSAFREARAVHREGRGARGRAFSARHGGIPYSADRAIEADFGKLDFFGEGRAALAALDARISYAAIPMAVRYLARALDQTQGLASSAVAAYNAGPDAVRVSDPRSILHRYGDLPTYPETVRYVQRLLAVYSAIKYRLYAG